MTMMIYPYLMGLNWVFDDEKTYLKEEAFVCGMSEMISRMVEEKRIPNASRGFAMQFSDVPFSGHDIELNWLRAADAESPLGGNWYSGLIAGQQMEGWLCPALFCFFPSAPTRLFVRADPLPVGVDPIWHVSSDDSRPHRFMGPEGK
ncbi:MAG: hypothetical protein JWP89_5602 [Schlesneria sp.]|nr:hypothetical protein [Schlesneria sp.]